MRTAESEVRSKQAVVGTATYEIFEDLQEAVESKGEGSILELINSQIKTNAMNTLRSMASGKPTKKALEAQAMASLTMEDLEPVIGDAIGLRNLITQKVQELEASSAAASSATATADDDDDDE